MRDVNANYRIGAEKKIRDVGVKILTNDDTKTIPSDRILSVNIQRSVSDGSFSIGNAPSDRLNAVIVGTEKLPKRTRITVYISFDGSGWERLGRFYVDSCTRNGQRITVTAYDALSLTEKPVKFGGNTDKGLEKLTFPCQMQEMLDYIAALRGMTCEFECQPFTVYEKPMKSKTEYYTARELFGMIAACHGCNAKMDADGKLTFREFGEVSAKFTAENVLDQTIDDGEPFTVRGVLFRRNETVSFYIDDVPGSEYDEETDGVVICNNPLATVEIAEYVWGRIGKLSYYGGSVKIRGAGILECGDVIPVGNLKNPTDPGSYPFCITDIAYSISLENGFIETLSSEVTRRSPASGSDFSSSLTAGTGIKIIGDTVNLKPARTGWSGEKDDLLGGVWTDGYGVKIEDDGRIHILTPSYATPGGVIPSNGLSTDSYGYLSVSFGKGMMYYTPDWYPHGSTHLVIAPKLGDGLITEEKEPGETEAEQEQNEKETAIRLNLGEGLAFGEREYFEYRYAAMGKKTGYTSKLCVKLGKNLSFGADGEINAEGGGKEYTAGENIEISDGGVISAIVREYKAGENIEISEDGTISAAAPGGAELTAGGGIAIETDAETGKRTVSAAVGEGAEIRDGKICTVPNIQTGILITEKDAKYFLHHFTETEYIAGNQIGYAGPGNQIVVQEYLAYTTDALDQGNIFKKTIAIYYPEDWTPNISRYMEFSGDFYSNDTHYTRAYLIQTVSTASSATYAVYAETEDGTVQNLRGGITNKDHWSGIGLALEWLNLYPPGYVKNEITYENGCAEGRINYFWKDKATVERVYARWRIDTVYFFPFASLAEYQAAVGLTYEPLTLTEVTDSPTIVSGSETEGR